MRRAPVLLVGLGLSCCGETRPGPVAERLMDPEVILSIRSGDIITEEYVTRVLLAKGIVSSTDGSIGWSTSVDRSQRERAIGILKSIRDLDGRLVWKGERAGPLARSDEQETIRGAPLAVALTWA
jgi:hypothetical protein